MAMRGSRMPRRIGWSEVGKMALSRSRHCAGGRLRWWWSGVGDERSLGWPFIGGPSRSVAEWITSELTPAGEVDLDNGCGRCGVDEVEGFS